MRILYVVLILILCSGCNACDRIFKGEIISRGKGDQLKKELLEFQEKLAKKTEDLEEVKEQNRILILIIRNMIEEEKERIDGLEDLLDELEEQLEEQEPIIEVKENIPRHSVAREFVYAIPRHIILKSILQLIF